MFAKRKPPIPQSEFMQLVQEHERAWGQESYPGRPNLTEILSAHVVVFWQIEGKADRSTISVHDNLDGVERFLARMLFVSSVDGPRKRIDQIYQNQKRVKVTGVKIQFRVDNDDEAS